MCIVSAVVIPYHFRRPANAVLPDFFIARSGHAFTSFIEGITINRYGRLLIKQSLIFPLDLSASLSSICPWSHNGSILLTLGDHAIQSTIIAMNNKACRFRSNFSTINFLDCFDIISDNCMLGM